MLKSYVYAIELYDIDVCVYMCVLDLYAILKHVYMF